MLIGSFIPGTGKEAIGTFTSYKEATGGALRWQHRAAHFVIFGATTLLFLLIARTQRERVAACLGGIAFGCAIEVAQYYIFRVGMEWWDVRDDTIAALAAFALGSMDRVRTRLVRD